MEASLLDVDWIVGNDFNMVEWDGDREEGLVRCSMVCRSMLKLSVKIPFNVFTLTREESS